MVVPGRSTKWWGVTEIDLECIAEKVKVMRQ